MPDFLLELRSQEIPARMQAGARASLEKLFREQLAAAGITPGAITVWSTPRRLALIAADLPEATEPLREEVKGPRTSAPEQALGGFLRKTGLTQDQLTERDGVWFAITEKPGRATAQVLAEAIPAICRAFPWPKSMRWGAASISTESLRWVRPLSGIVAILGEDLVDCEVGAIRSGYATLGHRFHHPHEITIGGAHDYADKLRACHVIVDHAEREALVRDGARAAAAEAGLTLVEDAGLVIENAGLTEWPVPLLGRFDAAFLEVPPEVIQLTARTNQKYFVCEDADGALANAFVCTANISATDGGAGIVAGNRKVLAARLSDARFFWEQDRKVSLEEHAKKLSRITFHEKLGTVADKVERVAKLARWLVEQGIVGSSPERGGGPAQLVEGHVRGQSASTARAESDAPALDPVTPPVPLHHPADGPPPPGGEERDRAQLADLAEQAALLCKADLVTEMVGEFPELQGLMGGYYARAEGLPVEVADAIRDHYKPVGQGDDVPTAPVTVALALADKLDTLLSFAAIGEFPTGSRDPFAIRRASLGILVILISGSVRLPLSGYPLRWKIFSDRDLQAYIGEGLKLMTPITVMGEPNPFDPSKLFFGLSPSDLLKSLERTIYVDQVIGFEDRVLDFLSDRLKVQQREAGVRHDLIDAVFALGGEDDLVRLLARVHALQAFVATEDGANLLAGYKRAANILKKEGYEAQAEQASEATHALEPAEQALTAALDVAVPQASAAVAAEEFAGAMAALATLRAPIDAFFDQVTVNDSDPAKRSGRLALLDRFRAAVHNVADFSRIEG